jgi:hypothetical protein
MDSNVVVNVDLRIPPRDESVAFEVRVAIVAFASLERCGVNRRTRRLRPDRQSQSVQMWGWMRLAVIPEQSSTWASYAVMMPPQL